MTRRHTLILMSLLTLLASGVRAVSLDEQSMWRDEIDTVCFAIDFWHTMERAANLHQRTETSSRNLAIAGSTAVSSPGEPKCQPTPGLSRVNPDAGLWPTLRALLTLPGWNGPLYTVGMRPWIGFTGYSPFAVRYSALLLGLLAVPLTYVLGKRMLGTAVGLVGAALVAMSPHLVWYSQEAKMYAAILALGLLAIYGLRQAIDQAFTVRLSNRFSPNCKSLRWWAVMVISTTLAFYSHILAVLLIPLEITLALIWWPRTRRHWRGATLALAVLTLPYLPLLVWQAKRWRRPAGEATLFAVRRIDVMLDATFAGWGGNFLGEPWATLILAGLALLALFGLTWIWLAGSVDERAAREGNGDRAGESDGRSDFDPLPQAWREVVALVAWMLLPLFVIWLISARQPIFTNRYLIWAAPAFYLLAAAGFVAAVRTGRAGTLAGLVLLFVILIGDARSLSHQATQPIKPDFKAAADYVERRYQTGDLVVFHLSYMMNNFEFYFEGEFDGWGAPAPAAGISDGDIDYHMRTNTNGYETVWLVLSESQMWDPQGIIKAWLDERSSALPHEQAFAHVSVFRYRMNQ